MKITLCGSTRFKENYAHANLELGKAGYVVYSVSGFGHSGDELTAEDKEVLDLVHLQKILNSDAILIVGQNEDGTAYIGSSTRREVFWARMLKKTVYTESDLPDLLEFGIRNQ